MLVQESEAGKVRQLGGKEEADQGRPAGSPREAELCNDHLKRHLNVLERKHWSEFFKVSCQSGFVAEFLLGSFESRSGA